ncbi:MAG: hypothetical protein COB85_00600 [Bacteroidetes bacterium]|nr:MAG: hypothetical protein COB85_00600 [Bacteroidota bacterium]
MDASSTTGLKDLISQYPYFQTAHLLYLKNLYDEKNINYSTQLKVAAVYANSRKKLYELVMQSDLRSRIEAVDTSASEARVTILDVSPLEQQILKEAVSASIELEVQSDQESVKETSRKTEKQTKKLSTKKKEPDYKGEHTFNQWMTKLTQGEQGVSDEQSSIELITSFIDKAPSLLRNIEKEGGEKEAFFSPIDTARLSIIDDEEFVTETLARIYESQNFYEKAIKAYELLSLKNPKNSNSFAARIKTLKKKLDAK